MRKLFVAGILFGLSVLLAGGDARADTLMATRGQPLYEVSHSIDVTISDGLATYEVRRTFVNGGTLHEEASLVIDLPHGAAVTGLRIRARDRWYDGELMEAEMAARLYAQLTGLGVFEPKDPALLHWLWADSVGLRIFPVAPGAASTVEYTLTVPVAYGDGHYLLSVPNSPASEDEGDTALATPVLRVFLTYGDALTPVSVDSRRMAPEAPIVLEPPLPLAWVGEGAPDPSAGHVISRLEISASGSPRVAEVELDIRHTYKGDLEVALVTPAGKRIVVHDRKGGGDNDIRGRFRVKLPRGTKAAGAWHLVASDHAGLDIGTLERWSLELDLAKGGARAFASTDTPLFIPDAPDGESSEGFSILRVGPPDIDTVAARLGRAVASPGKVFLRVELDTAPELRPLPKGAAVVFVVDASHSMGPDGIDAQLDIARAYSSHLPDARVEVVLYRRFAKRLTGTLVPAPELAGRIEAARADRSLRPGNGSAIEAGLRSAAAALAGHHGPKRIVAFSDDLLRESFDNTMALRALSRAPRGTIVHIVVPDRAGDEVEVERDDEHDLAPIAAAHGGIFVNLYGVPAETEKELAAGVLSLVRPVRIDAFEIVGLPEDALSEVPETLEEGSGYREMVLLGTAPAKIVLRGMIWGRPYERVVSTTAVFNRATAGFVFSEDAYDDLTEAEMMKLAMFGRAVSPVTSYLAIEPGVRPSTVGLDGDAIGEAFGVGGLGLMGTGSGGGGTGGWPPDLDDLMARGANRCIAKHASGDDWTVELRVETTYDEVVDVIVDAGRKLAVAECIRDAAWALRLDRSFGMMSEWFELSYP